MSYPWENGYMSSDFGGTWDPNAIPLQNNTDNISQRENPKVKRLQSTAHGFANTSTSFSSGTAWSGCSGSSTMTCSSSSTSYPISSVGSYWAVTSSLSKDASEETVDWPTGPPIKRWQDPDTAGSNWEEQKEEQDMMDAEMMEEEGDQVSATSSVGYASPISKQEFEKQAKEYTKNAVAELIASPEYQKKYTTCHLCWCVWAHAQYGEDCLECGGFGMKRSCPICDGRCDRIWTRDVDMSHSNHYAHWEGECGLPEEQRQGFLMQKLLDNDEPLSDEQLAEDFSELKSS